MPERDGRFGADLRLLENLDRQSDRERGADLRTVTRPGTRGTDLAVVEGAANLEQALLLRFLTAVGELAPLGHASYGSELGTLVGELNNETNRNRAKMFVLQALAEEPRVREVRSISVTASRVDRTRVDISVSLLAIDSDTVLNLVFPFFLEGGAPV